MPIHIYIPIYIYMPIYIYIYTYLYIYTHIPIYIYIHIPIYIYTHTHTYVYIHTYLYIRTHTYIYIYTHHPYLPIKGSRWKVERDNQPTRNISSHIYGHLPSHKRGTLTTSGKKLDQRTWDGDSPVKKQVHGSKGSGNRD